MKYDFGWITCSRSLEFGLMSLFGWRNCFGNHRFTWGKLVLSFSIVTWVKSFDCDEIWFWVSISITESFYDEIGWLYI